MRTGGVGRDRDAERKGRPRGPGAVRTRRQRGADAHGVKAAACGRWRGAGKAAHRRARVGSEHRTLWARPGLHGAFQAMPGPGWPGGAWLSPKRVWRFENLKTERNLS